MISWLVVIAVFLLYTMYDNHITGKATEASYIWFFLYRISGGVIPAAVWDNIRTGLQSRNNPLVYRAIFKAFPFFKKLEKEYGALYTTYISYITSSERTLFDDPRVFDDLYLFIADFAIHVICRFDSSQHIVIPFDSILYQEHRISNFFARLRHNARYTYAYHFTLGVLYNGSMEKISFCTNYYNHRIDRMFNNRLDSMGLYEYISNRFPDSEESGFWYFDILKAFS